MTDPTPDAPPTEPTPPADPPAPRSTRVATAALVFGLLPLLALLFLATGGYQWLPELLYPEDQGFQGLGVVLMAILVTAVLTVLGALGGLVLGIVALLRIRSGRWAGRGRAIAAVVLGAAWLLLVITYVLIFTGALQSSVVI